MILSLAISDSGRGRDLEAVGGGDLTLKPQIDSPRFCLVWLWPVVLASWDARQRGCWAGLVSCLLSGLCQQDVEKGAQELGALITHPLLPLRPRSAAIVLNTWVVRTLYFLVSIPTSGSSNEGLFLFWSLNLAGGFPGNMKVAPRLGLHLGHPAWNSLVWRKPEALLLQVFPAI